MIKYKFLIGILRLVAHLPLRVLYLISDFVYLLVYYVVGYRRKIVAQNLRLAFPQADEAELRGVERRFYRHLCDIFVETVKLLHISDREVNRRIEICGAELANAYVDSGKSVVLFLGHYGNWEWVTSIARCLSSDCSLLQIYHPLRDRVMDKVMLTIRSRFHSESIPMRRAVRRLMEIVQDGGKFICGFISDQRPSGSVSPSWTDFMGLDTPYINGGEKIGRHLGAAYLYVDMEMPRRGHYRITFKEIEVPVDDKEEFPVTRQYLRMLERSIRRKPELWLWSHNRWSRKRPTELPLKR